MKHLFSFIIVIGIIGLLVAPGMAGDHRHSRGKHFVTINFEHDTQYDVPLWPTCPPCLEYIPGLEQWCGITHVPAPPYPGIVLTGDVEGFNVLLSDVICFDGDPTDWDPVPSSARVEAPGYISGTLDTGEPIHLFGRMVLNIDLSSGFPAPMNGIWVFDKGFGTHHGVLRVIGTTNGEVGTGTYTGWIRENR